MGDGRNATLVWRRLDASHTAVHITADTPAFGDTVPFTVAQPVESMRATIAFLWTSPFPALLQDAEFNIVDVNNAFLEFGGSTRQQLIGSNPAEFRATTDRAATPATRPRQRQPLPESGATLTDGRIVDAAGRERRFRIARHTLADTDGAPMYLAVLQDLTDEHVAREHADRSLRELDDWFDLSPVGMVLSDDQGLLVRTNPAFDALIGSLPVSLADAPEGLRELLGWAEAAEQAPVQREAWVGRGDEPARLLRAIVRCHRSASGRLRTMAVIEDRSAEEERDLAHLQIGALMDTAGVALATFQESSGWVRQGRAKPASGKGDKADKGDRSGKADRTPVNAMLHTINREIIAPASLPEFERLQTALRRAEHAEVRYAIRHPELGERWLLTRVEPATLGSGKRTTSAITLDITDQHRSTLRTEELLHELSTILESTNAGIAYLRGDVLVRCNRRFEAMLGQNPGSIEGRTLRDLLGAHEQTGRITAEAWQLLSEGLLYETEFNMLVEEDGREQTRWYSLSVRRAGAADNPMEAIVALVDVTRLKAQQQEFEILARDRELMFSLSGVGIAFLREGRIQRANQALAQLAGCTVAELSALPLAELFIDAADYERRWPQVDHSLFEHGRWSGERQLRARDGRAIWVQVSKQLVTADDIGGGIIASYVNVDARVRAERAVSLQAGRTRAILDSALVGIVTVGPLGIEWMNRSARRMFGAELAELVNQPIATVATDDPEHPFLRTRYLTDLVEGEAETFECQVMARDGRQFWVVGNVVSTARESGGRQLTYALLDIERRRDAEARMSQAQSQLQRIIEAAPLAITLRDAKTLRILQVNGVAAANAGTTPAALIGLAPEDMFGPLLALQHRADMERALASDQVTRCEYRSEHDGELRVWDASYLPLAETEGGPPEQLLLVATDVTAQRAAQEARFEAAIAQREMLVKEVHHRIKNNLQGVAGLLQQIGQRKPEVAGPIAEVVGQVQAIAQVYGLQVGASGPLQIISVVRAITGSVQRTFGRSIVFEASGPAPEQWMLPEAEAIPIALTLNELLTNALKHSPAASDVHCGLVDASRGIEVTISNPGQLPPGFGLARIPGGVSGLGLVRALLPRRSAQLTIEQQGDRVLAVVSLQPPCVERS